MGCKKSEKAKMQKHKKGLWSPDEDLKLKNHIMKYGHGCWSSIPLNAGNFFYARMSTIHTYDYELFWVIYLLQLVMKPALFWTIFSRVFNLLMLLQKWGDNMIMLISERQQPP